MQEVEGRTFEIARNLGIDHNPPHEMLIEKGTYERSYRIGEGNYVYVWKGWK